MTNKKNADHNLCTVAEIESALFSLYADCDYEDWIKIAASLYSQLGESGSSLFDTWSSQGQKYNAKTHKGHWNNAKGLNKIGLGTLFYYAKESGWKSSKPSGELDIDNLSAIAEMHKKQQLAAKDKEKCNAEQTLARQLKIYKKSSYPLGNSSYLKKKFSNGQIDRRFTGLRCTANNELLVPMQNIDKEIVSFQILMADFKRFLKHCPIGGAFFVLGRPLDNVVADQGTVGIVEGLATGLTAFATEHFDTIVVAFTASGIKRVAAELKNHYPKISLIGIADNDQWTKSFKGVESCHAAGIQYLLPNFAEFNHKIHLIENDKDKPTDFNDLLKYSDESTVKRQLDFSNIKGVAVKRIAGEFISGCFDIKDGLNIIESGTGTGKTTVIKAFIAEQIANGKSVLYIAPERTLIDQIAIETDLYHYLSLQANGHNYLKGCRALIITPNSLPKNADSQFDVVIVDECESVLKNLINSATFNSNRLDVFNVLSGLLNTSSTQILMDAYISDVSLDFCHHLELTGQHIINDRQSKAGRTIKLYPNQASGQHESDLIADINSGVKVVFSTSSKTKITEIMPAINEDIKVFALTADTQKSVREEFMEGLPESANQYDVIMLSPTAGCGFSVADHHFTKGYSYFGTSNLDVDTCLQRMDRFRNITDHNVCLYDTHSHDPSVYPTNKEIIRAGLYTNLYKTAGILGIDPLSAKLKCTSDGLESLFIDVTCHANKSKIEFRALYLDKTQSLGYEIVELEKDELLDKARKEDKKEMRQYEKTVLRSQIESCPLLSEVEMSAGKTKDNSLSYEKTQLQSLLGIEGTELDEIMFLEKTVGYTKKLWPLVLCLSPECYLHGEDAFDMGNRDFSCHMYHTLTKRHYAQILKFAGINDRLKAKKMEWNSSTLTDFVAYIEKAGDELQSLGIISSPKKALVFPTKSLNHILNSISKGLVLQRKSDKERFYSIDKERLETLVNHAEKIFQDKAKSYNSYFDINIHESH